MQNPIKLQTIDLGLLDAVCGGDGWDDYKQTVSEDAQAALARWRAARDHNLVNGNWDFVKWADNMGGFFYNAGKTVWDASLGQLFGIAGAIKKK